MTQQKICRQINNNKIQYRSRHSYKRVNITKTFFRKSHPWTRAGVDGFYITDSFLGEIIKLYGMCLISEIKLDLMLEFI